MVEFPLLGIFSVVVGRSVAVLDGRSVWIYWCVWFNLLVGNLTMVTVDGRQT